jgi:signal transduction histidine kinase
VQLLRRSFRLRADLDPTQTRSLQIVEEQIDKLAQLVTRLLETVQIQGDRFALFKEPTDIAALVRSAVDRLDAPSRQRTSLTAPESVMVEIDPLRFDQVLANLLSNAIKFSPRGEAVFVSLEREGGGVRLSVFDHGPGVPEDKRIQLFRRFFQANPDRSGMGLGLFITKEIVEAHGGTIAAEFPASGGTRFTVRVPA